MAKVNGQEALPMEPNEGIVVQQPAEVTPMALLQLAMSQGADLAKLEKLMELQERFEANRAKKAFVVAMNAFKEHPPEIAKNRKASFGGQGREVSYDYATLDNVCEQVTQSLSKHGITHRWKVEQTDALIRVTCVLTHELGHSEETTLASGADTSGAKNAIQAIGSAISYLERYTLLAATGLAVKGMDKDGSPDPPMEGIEDVLKAIQEAPDTSALSDIFKRAFKEATAKNNPAAMKAIVAAKDERKKALEAQ